MTDRADVGRWMLGGTLALAVAIQLVVGILLIDSRRDLSAAERERDAYATCTSRWQQQFAAAYKARIEVSIEERAALEEVVRSVAAQDQRRFDRAIDAYVATRDNQLDEQQQNPYPPLPNELCGEKPRKATSSD